jgi:hypothetical protein
LKVCGAGLIGTPEAFFRTALTTHPWIFNLLKGNWVKELTEAKRDGMDGGAYGPRCPAPWVSHQLQQQRVVVEDKALDTWDLPADEYSDLLHRQATEMMNTQTTMAEALFRRSKTLRWSCGHHIISIYPVIL